MNRSDGDGPETSTWVVGKLSCRNPTTCTQIARIFSKNKERTRRKTKANAS